MDYLVTFLLLALSALFSGLTLGLMGLSTHALSRQARLGNHAAAAIYPIRKRGNQLLATLLLGNVAVNSAISIFLSSIAPGIIAGIIATILILILGELIPQAIFARHALRLGAYAAPLVRFLMILSWPITYPIACLVDRALGEELPTIYSKRELMEIVSEHEDSVESPIDTDEERIVHGALQFSHKTVAETMTVHPHVVTLQAGAHLDDRLRATIATEGYSRYPVLEDGSTHVIGILYTKDILMVAKSETVGQACDRTLLRAKPTDTLDTVLAHMLTRRQHMAIVLDESGTFQGVITMEDILEEVIQREILDEDDEELSMTDRG